MTLDTLILENSINVWQISGNKKDNMKMVKKKMQTKYYTT